MNKIGVNISHSLKSGFFSEIIKHAPRYFGASAISAIIAMLMTKYYTHVFSPAEYGILALYVSMSQYIQSFIGFSFDTVSQRVYFEYPFEEKPAFLGTVLIFLIAASCISLLLLLAFMSSINRFLGGGILLFLLTVSASIACIFVNFLSRIAYNEKLSGLVVKQTVVQTAINHGLGTVWIMFVSRSIASRQGALLVAYLVNIVTIISSLRARSLFKVRWVFNTIVFKKVFGFALPTVATLVLGTSFSYVDRLLLNHYHGKSNVGIYSLGFSIAAGIGMVTEAVSMALFPSIMSELKIDYAKGIRRLKQVDAFFCLFLFSIGIFCWLFSPYIISLFSNKDYSKAADVLPFIAFGYVIGGGYKVVSSVLSFHGRVWYLPFVSILAFGFGALMNILLIPRFNEIGAAYATFLGMFFYSYIQHIIGHKYYVSLKVITVVYVFFLFGVSLWFLKITGLLFYFFK